MILIQMTDLQVGTWSPNTGASVNPVPADAITGNDVIDNGQEVMQVTEVGTKQYAGGLVSATCPLPLINGVPLPYIRAKWKFKLSQQAIDLLHALEMDLKPVFPPAPNSATQVQGTYDLSTQWNKIAQQWQIDDATYKWASTGIAENPLVADQWVSYTVDYKLDFTKKVHSVLRIQVGSAPAQDIPTSMQNIPAMITNWAMYVDNVPQPLIKPQFQIDFDTTPGGIQVEFTLDIDMSDTPFS